MSILQQLSTLNLFDVIFGYSNLYGTVKPSIPLLIALILLIIGFGLGIITLIGFLNKEFSKKTLIIMTSIVIGSLVISGSLFACSNIFAKEDLVKFVIEISGSSETGQKMREMLTKGGFNLGTGVPIVTTLSFLSAALIGGSMILGLTKKESNK